MIISAKLGDKYGRKQMFILAVLGFALSSLAIGLSVPTTVVIAFRTIQEIFGALYDKFFSTYQDSL